MIWMGICIFSFLMCMFLLMWLFECLEREEE